MYVEDFLKTKRDTQYKPLGIVGCILLVAVIILEVEIWLLEYKRQLRLSDKNVDYYQSDGEIENFLKILIKMHLEALENIMLVCGTTHKYEGSGMNGTNDNTTKEPTEDHLSRHQFPRDILMLEQERKGAIYNPAYLGYIHN